MRRSLIIAAALMCCWGSLKAQDESDSLRMVEMQRVQVIASRAGEKTPVAYTNVSSQQIARTNFGQDLPYVLSMVPSLVPTSDAGTGIGYTALRIRGTDATRINITSNGVPMNDAESHSLFWVNMPDFASSVKDIQVQRGAGTSTNGAGAFGGSINMSTAIETSPYAELTATYGIFNTHRESVRFGTGLLGGHWILNARLSNIGSDGYVDRASARLKSYFAQLGYYNKGTSVRLISFGGDEQTYHAWNGVTMDEIEKYGRRYNSCGVIVAGASGDSITYPDQKDFYTQINNQLIISQQLAGGWRLNLTGHYTRGDGYYQEYKKDRTLSEYGLVPFLDSEGVRIEKSDLVRQKKMWNNFGGVIASASYDSERLAASIGAAWNRYAGDHFGKVSWIKNYIGDLLPDHEYYRNNTVKDDANVFAKAEWTVAKGLSVYADLQYRYIHHAIDGANDNYDWMNERMQRLDVDREYHFFNPKIGVYYDIDGHNAVYLSAAVAQKEPTRNNFTDAKFNARPKAEKMLDVEAGYKLDYGFISAGANLYFMRYRDQLIQTGELNDIGEALSDNVPDSYRAGVELSLSADIAKWLHWDLYTTLSMNKILHYTEYMSMYDENWDDLWKQTSEYLGTTTIAFSPSVIAGSLISVNFGKFYGGLQTQYVSKQYTSNGEHEALTLPRYCVSNLRLSYRFDLPSLKWLEVGVAVNNLFNKKYFSNGFGSSSMICKKVGEEYVPDYRSDYAGYYPQATINVLGSVTLRF